MGPLKCFTISRKRWIHTPEDLVHKSLLLRRSDNKMCCLGFAGKACGLRDCDILDKGDYFIFPFVCPSVACPVPQPLSWLGDIDPKTGATKQDLLTVINDSPELPAKDKETLIASIFAQHGIEVTFID